MLKNLKIFGYEDVAKATESLDYYVGKNMVAVVLNTVTGELSAEYYVGDEGIVTYNNEYVRLFVTRKKMSVKKVIERTKEEIEYRNWLECED